MMVFELKYFAIKISSCSINNLGLKGYQEEVRDMMMFRVVSTKSYVVEPELMLKRKKIAMMEYIDSQEDS